MSYEEFRRRIDTARNILVGAVPSPAGQIDQITYALMYKFMNDIDDQSAALPGGKRTYFTGDYEKYNWHALMSPTLGAHERLELYRQAIQTMAKNENLPPLFREIYQNAFLPFNSSNVLNLFLKEIDYFSHGESDGIGDVYEYLLSITGAQGDVGQFRTPRHIIKFIVEAVNPTKDDIVLDPACGTAGFLIAAYNHVKSQHDGKDGNGNKNDEKSLTADERGKIYKNYHGFDIDPTMVRTARVNMYLHGFSTPDIINHDTLSSEDFWDKRYDVILANPPFMTPKGGIQPHKKFSINANRAEVLFIDYIASHINPVIGRAGIIVPEGVIFQSGKAYKDLRKNLVENYLYAVVSLPSGVFNPYAGVKTSILLLDKELAKQRDEIMFVKIENDGYSLGAQRRKIEGDQFSDALKVIEQFKNGEELNSNLAHVVSKNAIAESGDYNLSGDRYKVVAISDSQYPLTALGDICKFIRGITFSHKDHADEGSDFYALVATTKAAQADGIRSKDLVKVNPSVIKKDEVILQEGDFLISIANSANLLGRKTFVKELPVERTLSFGAFMACLRVDRTKILPEYLNPFLESDEYKRFCLARANTTTNISNLNWSDLSEFTIPLPPIEIQREVVAELDDYQKIIGAAQTIIKNWKPKIDIDPEWVKIKIGEVAKLMTGGTPLTSKSEYYGGDIKWLVSGDINKGEIFDCEGRITGIALKESNARLLPINSVLIALNGQGKTRGTVAILRVQAACNQSLVAIIPEINRLLPEFLLYVLKEKYQEIRDINGDSQRGGLNMPIIRSIEIHLPPLEIQKQIVEKIEAERQIVEANKKLIEIYQQKIKSKIAEVWGDN
jgi:type I restriction enzyme M protein